MQVIGLNQFAFLIRSGQALPDLLDDPIMDQYIHLFAMMGTGRVNYRTFFEQDIHRLSFPESQDKDFQGQKKQYQPETVPPQADAADLVTNVF